jgi:membrane protein implicated in regulation of membrane protease activity
MGWIDRKIERAKTQGTAPFLMWVISKFFIGLGIAFLIAGLLPSGGWVFWGLLFIILGVIFAFPVARAVFRKR